MRMGNEKYHENGPESRAEVAAVVEWEFQETELVRFLVENKRDIDSVLVAIIHRNITKYNVISPLITSSVSQRCAEKR